MKLHAHACVVVTVCACCSALVASDLMAFFTTPGAYKISGASPISFDCGANPTNDGACMFDLNTEVQVNPRARARVRR